MRPGYICIVLAGLLGLALSAPGGAGESTEPEPPPITEPVARLLRGPLKQVQEGRLREALAALPEAIETAENNRDRAGLAYALTFRAHIQSDLGLQSEAAATWEEAAAAWAQAGDAPMQIEAFTARALLIYRQAPETALELLQRAAAAGRADRRRPRASSTALEKAGREFGPRGRLAEARVLFEGAYQAARRVDPRGKQAGANLVNLGVIARGQGQLSAARSYLEQGLPILEAVLGPEAPEVAATLGNLAVVVREQGDLLAARTLAERSLQLRISRERRSAAVSDGLVNLGNVLMDLGDLAGARLRFQQALAIAEDVAKDTATESTCLNNLGVVAGMQGDLDASSDYHQRALEILRRDSRSDESEIAVLLNNLGVNARDRGDLAAAVRFFGEALEIQRRIQPISIPTSATLNNLGVIARRSGDLENARTFLLAALALRERIAPGTGLVAMTLNNLGAVALDAGNTAEAEGYFRRSAEIRERLAPDSLPHAFSLQNLAAAAFHQGNSREAVALGSHAWKIVRSHRASVSGDEARQAFGQRAAPFAANLAEFQLASGDPDAAFRTVEEGRAQSLQEQMAERGLDVSRVPSARWSRYQMAVKQQERAGEALAAAAAAQEAGRLPNGGALTAAEAREAYTRARVEAQERWDEVRRAAPQVFIEPADPKSARQSLPSGTLFLSFSAAEDATLLFVVRADVTRAYRLDLSEEKLREAVSGFRKLVTGAAPGERGTRRVPVVGERDALDQVRQAGADLYRRLFPPEAHAAITAARRVVISPDGPLWELPFAALPTSASAGDGAKAPFLGLAKPLVYTQSLTLYAKSLQNRPGRASAPAALCFGNPDLGSLGSAASGEPRLLFGSQPPPPLPSAEQEALRVAELYRTSAITGAAATEAALRSRAPAVDVLHLAAHGFLHPLRAMSSGLLLAPDGGEADDAGHDGALQAWEIFDQLKLRADLVVLSACETGRGAAVKSEGLVGLTRSLQVAGARSVVASQWQVADRATEALMVRFHQSLTGGAAKDEALRVAMSAVARDPRTAHPYFWAPFLLTGDPENNLFALRAGAVRPAAPGPAAPPSTRGRPADAATQKTIRALYSTIERGYRTRSVGLIAGQWAPDYTETPQTGAPSSRDVEVLKLRTNFAHGDQWKVTHQVLGLKILTPNTLEAWVRNRMTMTGADFNARGDWTERHLWVRAAGKWKLRSVQVVKSHL